jgi:hypothetical protein
MDMAEASRRTKEISERFSRLMDEEIAAQSVSPEVAAVVKYIYSKAFNDALFYFQSGKICTFPQFMRAMEIIVRNYAESIKEQLAVLIQVSE